MKLEYEIGNLIEAKEHIIAHGCNARGVMGSGVARAIRDAFPEAYDEYRREYEIMGLKLGQVVWAKSRGKIIANCITQQHYGRDGQRYVMYSALRECMQIINNVFIHTPPGHPTESFALPMIGAGLGGGDWTTIEAIIAEECTHVQPVVYQLEQA